MNGPEPEPGEPHGVLPASQLFQIGPRPLNMLAMTSFDVSTRAHTQLIDITDRVQAVVHKIGIENGVCVVFVPHTTAGVTIQENADPDVQHDLLAALAHAVPDQLPGGYRHGERNSPAHVKTSLVGSSATMLVEGGELVLGTWQGIYLCEFDGPRTRRVLVKALRG
ncbi:MAG TPA: secondary thiamine-phosphate synthase enzyme YjbQ [Longimicrobiales bacterium]